MGIILSAYRGWILWWNPWIWLDLNSTCFNPLVPKSSAFLTKLNFLYHMWDHDTVLCLTFSFLSFSFYFRRLVCAMFGDKRPGNNIGWNDPRRIPRFYPEWLPWCDPNRKPANVASSEWGPLLRRGIGVYALVWFVSWVLNSALTAPRSLINNDKKFSIFYVTGGQ